METITKYLARGALTNPQREYILKIVKEPRGGKLDAFLRRLKKGAIVDLNVRITTKKTLRDSKRRWLLVELVKAGVLPDASISTTKTLPYAGGCLIVNKHQLTSDHQMPGDIRDLNMRLNGTVHFELLKKVNKPDIPPICALAGIPDEDVDSFSCILDGIKGDILTNRQIFGGSKLTEAQKNNLIVVLMNIGVMREVCGCSEGTCNPDMCKRGHVFRVAHVFNPVTAPSTAISADLAKFGIESGASDHHIL